MEVSREEPTDHTPKPKAESLQVRRLITHACLPQRVTEGSVGYDAFAPMDFDIPPGTVANVGLGIAAKPPEGTYIRIAAKSGLASRHLNVRAGVVDPDFVGEIRVLMENASAHEMATFQKGQAIAQLILERMCIAEVQEVRWLPKTVRGRRGFGTADNDRCAKITPGRLRAADGSLRRASLIPGSINWDRYARLCEERQTSEEDGQINGAGVREDDPEGSRSYPWGRARPTEERASFRTHRRIGSTLAGIRQQLQAADLGRHNGERIADGEEIGLLPETPATPPEARK